MHHPDPTTARLAARTPKTSPPAPAGTLPSRGRHRQPSALGLMARACALACGAWAWAGTAQALDPQALPSQGQVTGGSATLLQQPGLLTVQQHSGRVVIDWGRFEIGSAARVDFVQRARDALAINRVVGGEASLIQGQLGGFGRVFIVNPAGVIFGAGAEVQVGGLLATTVPLADSGGLRNRVMFNGPSLPGAVVRNEGTITTAPGGSIVLLGPEVANAGTLAAPGGDVTLAAGSAATVELGSNGRTTLTLDAGAAGARAENTGTVLAEGGSATLQALGTGPQTAGLVNQAGLVRAQAVSTRGGVVRLLAADGEVRLAGQVDVGAGHAQPAGELQLAGARVLVTADAAVRLEGGGHWRTEAGRIDITAGTGNGPGAGIAAPVLGQSLQQGDVTLAATQGAVSIDAPVVWHSGRLSLDAAEGIAVNAGLDATLDAATAGGGRLALGYGLAAPAAGNAADYRLAAGVKIALPAGETFSTRQGSDGAARDYTVITALGSENLFDGRTLQGMNGRLDGWFALGADIDASATAGWNGGEGFVSIGSVNDPFTGRLAGLGHSVSGLSIVRLPDSQLPSFLLGLFSTIQGAQLRDLTMVGGQVRGTTTQIGALVGRDRGGSRIEGVSVLDTVVTGGGHGGIVGRQDGERSTYRRLYSRAELRGTSASNYVGTVGGVVQTAVNLDLEDVRSDAIMPPAGTAGGIAAFLTGRLVNAHASSEVRAIATGGGLVGHATLSEFRDSSASGNVIAAEGPNKGIGGLVGQLDGSAVGERLSASGHVTANGHLLNDVGGLIGRSSIALRDATASGNVNVNVTRQFGIEDTTSSIGGLVGRMTGPGTSSGLQATGHVTVNTVQRLAGVGGLIGSSTAALHDVRAEGTVSARTSFNDSANPSLGVGGLVGIQGAADITDASALGAVSAHHVRYTGGLVGQTGGSLQRVAARGDVTHTGAGLQTGGLAGRIDNGSVQSASATGRVASSGNEVGGLVGTIAGAGVRISDSYATGTVSGLAVLGGLVGNNTAGLNRVFASGDVSTINPGAQRIGGLVGQHVGGGAERAIVDAYATGRVSGGTIVGGLVGQLSGEVVRSYASGAVSGSAQAGGLVGAVLGGGSATASYWNTETSGRSTSAVGTGLTSAQMANPASFAGWDISADPSGTSVWLLLPGQAAPRLRGLTPAAGLQLPAAHPAINLTPGPRAQDLPERPRVMPAR